MGFSAPQAARAIRVPLSLYLLGAMFVAAICVLLWLQNQRASILSDVRAVVAAQGTYSTACKNAVIQLLRYARSGLPAGFRAFEDALGAALVDRDARSELRRLAPDLGLATEGFRRAGNDPTDAVRVVRFFVRFQREPHVAAVASGWAEADRELDTLQELGGQLHRLMRAANSQPQALDAVLEQIGDAHERLSVLERRFSLSLGDSARFLLSATEQLMISIALVLAGLLALYAWRVSIATGRAHAALSDSEARYRALSENLIDGLLILRDGRFVHANTAAQRLLGHSLDELRGQPFAPLVHPAFQASVAERHRRRIAGDMLPPRYDIQVLTRGGKVLWVQLANTRIDWDGSPAVLTIISDVSERKRAERQLAESEALKSGILDSSMDAVITMDHRGNIVEFNVGAERLIACARAEAIGRPLAALIVPPELREAHTCGLQRYISTGSSTVLGRRIEVQAQRADGSRFEAELAIVRIAASDPPLFTGTLRDISERKRNEAAVRTLNESLEERVRERTAELESALDEMESFSYSISHDLRAPLRAINSFSGIVLRQHAQALDAQGRRLLERVERNALSMSGLIDSLLDFARLGRCAMSPEPLDVEAQVRSVVAELLVERGSNAAQIIVNGLPRVHGDVHLLRQVWVNLISNALKFSAASAPPRIEIGATRQDGNAVFHVRDNGVGFDMAHASKLFGVFQRLHADPAIPGTGIGLALVRRILARHNARVWARSSPGEGATFYFSLPAA